MASEKLHRNTLNIVRGWRDSYLSGHNRVVSQQKYVWPDNLTGASRKIIASPDVNHRAAEA